MDDDDWDPGEEGFPPRFVSLILTARKNKGRFPIRHFDGHVTGPSALVFSPASDYIAAGGRGGVGLYDVKTGERVRGFTWDGLKRGQTRSKEEDVDGRKFYLKHIMHSIAFTPDGRTIAAGDEDGNVYCWNVATGALRWHKDGKKHGRAKDFKPRLVFSSQQQVWLDDPKFPNKREGHGRNAVVATSPDGKLVVSSGNDGFVRAWNVNKGTLIVEVNMARAGRPMKVPFMERDPCTGNEIFTDEIRSFPYGDDIENEPHFPVGALAFSPDGRWIACSMDSTHLAVDPILAIDSRSWMPFQVADFPEPRIRKRWWDGGWIPVYCVAKHISFSKDGCWLVTDGEEGARLYTITQIERDGLSGGNGVNAVDGHVKNTTMFCSLRLSGGGIIGYEWYPDSKSIDGDVYVTLGASMLDSSSVVTIFHQRGIIELLDVSQPLDSCSNPLVIESYDQDDWYFATSPDGRRCAVGGRVGGISMIDLFDGGHVEWRPAMQLPEDHHA